MSGVSPCSACNLLCKSAKLGQKFFALGRRQRSRGGSGGLGLHRNLFRHIVGRAFDATVGAFDFAGWAAKLAANFENLLDELLFFVPARLQSGEARLLSGQLFFCGGFAFSRC